MSQDVFFKAHGSHVYNGVFMAFLNLATNLSLLSVLYVGGSLIAAGQLTAGSLTQFAIQSAFVGLGFSGLASFHGETLKSLDAAARLLPLLHHTPPSSVAPEASAPLPGCLAELREVTFRHTGQPLLFRDLDLQLPHSALIAIVGASGSGKSSMLSLLCGLRLPDKGAVWLNGRQLQCEQDWVSCRGLVGVVEQRSGLLAGTVHENIAYGLREDAADLKERVLAAAKAAQADQFVERLPLGYGSPVGAAGCLLSGGQAARIVLARALVRRPLLLLLDEPTAALDAEAEAQILDTLLSIARGVAVVVFTHSPAVLQRAASAYRLSRAGGEAAVATIERIK